MSDRTSADNMVFRLITNQEQPRTHTDNCFLKLRELALLEPGGGGCYGITLEKLSQLQYPEDGPSRRSFKKEVSVNARQVRYAMEAIGLDLVPVTRDISTLHPHWKTNDFICEPQRDVSFICGRDRPLFGFLLVSSQRRGALTLRIHRLEDHNGPIAIAVSGRQAQNQSRIRLISSRSEIPSQPQTQPQTQPQLPLGLPPSPSPRFSSRQIALSLLQTRSEVRVKDRDVIAIFHSNGFAGQTMYQAFASLTRDGLAVRSGRGAYRLAQQPPPQSRPGDQETS